MKRQQMGIISDQKHPIAQHGYTTVGSFCRVSCHLLRARTHIVPESAAALGVEHKYLVGPRNVHHAVHNDGGDLESELIYREDPLDRKALHIPGVDLRKGTVPVSTDIAVVRRPVSRLRVRHLLERGSALRLHRKGLCSRLDAAEGTQVGKQIRALVPAAARGWHVRTRLLCNLCDLIVRQQVKLPVKILDLNAVPALIPCESLDCVTVAQLDRHLAISWGDLS